jgi:hypothetical protein
MFDQGFVEKCAEFGVDPDLLIKVASIPMGSPNFTMGARQASVGGGSASALQALRLIGSGASNFALPGMAIGAIGGGVSDDSTAAHGAVRGLATGLGAGAGAGIGTLPQIGIGNKIMKGGAVPAKWKMLAAMLLPLIGATAGGIAANKAVGKHKPKAVV